MRRGNAHPNIVPYDAFECSDGYFLLAVGNDAQFARFCDALDIGEVAKDPRFTTNQFRIENRSDLMPLITPAMHALPRAVVMERLRAVKVPCGPIHTVGEALTSDQAQARGAVVDVPREGGEDLRLLANPLKFSATPVRYDRAPPHVGQDTEEVLEKWGAAAPEIP